jgi:hypothetical protein
MNLPPLVPPKASKMESQHLSEQELHLLLGLCLGTFGTGHRICPGEDIGLVSGIVHALLEADQGGCDIRRRGGGRGSGASADHAQAGRGLAESTLELMVVFQPNQNARAMMAGNPGATAPHHGIGGGTANCDMLLLPCLDTRLYAHGRSQT